MSTLLITENFPPKIGGSSSWFWELYRRFPRNRVVFAVGEDPHQESFDRSHDLRVVRVPLTISAWGIRSITALRGYWRALRALRRILKRESIHQIHCGRVLPEGWIGWLLQKWYRIPYLCYVHGEDIATASTSRELSWMVSGVLHQAFMVIANSHNTRHLIETQWSVPAEKIQVLHPGMDTHRFSPVPSDPSVRERLGWGNRPVVLTVGRLQKRKGHDQMICALASIREAIPDVLYAIIGDGKEREALRTLIGEHGLEQHVQMRGETDDDDLLHCFQQCDLFVLPNRQIDQDFEGFGIVLLEAQSCGKPVVAGDSGGTAETMRIPETGLVVECERHEALARVVTELLKDRPRRDRMGQTGRKWVVENFDCDVLSRQAADLFCIDTLQHR